MDMYEFGAMEAALSFDLENDPDLVAIEANLDTIDYALESARIEYNISGDSRYAAVLEAAEEKQKSGIKDWFGTLTKKVSLFVKNAIQSVRAALSRLANTIRLKKAKKMQEKIGNVKATNPNIYDANISGSVWNSLKTGLTKDPAAAIDSTISSFIAALQKSGSLDSGFKTQAKNDIYSVGRDGGGRTYAILATDVKPILDKAVKYLDSLGKSFPKAKDRINKENASGTDKGVIRVATSSAYNVVTAAVKEYYTNAMKVANAVCKFDKKSTKDAEKASKQAEKAAEKAAKKENK